MKVIQSSKELSLVLNNYRLEGRNIGFVPTMGALHQGHLSLVQQAKEKSDVAVVSIFVNPNQFNNPEDLENYPRDVKKDEKLLESIGCELLFVPDVKDIYPQPDTRKFDFGELDKVMEGKFRPGHFNGVAQVVSKLFDKVQPDKAFFGEKDFQQLAIIRQMVKKLGYLVEIVACPIIREEDGLAMSSRNVLLSSKQRKKAPIIAKTLFESCNFVHKFSVEETRNKIISKINSSPELEVEYFEIIDGNDLQPIESWQDSCYIVGCIAVFAGSVRLIDNVIYKNKLS